MRDKRSNTRRTPARSRFVWLTILALLLAPVIVNLTHLPVAITTADDLAAHGHSHGDADEGLVASHDATDHEHQLQGLIHRAGDNAAFRETAGSPSKVPMRSGAIREGPRRPPRLV